MIKKYIFINLNFNSGVFLIFCTLFLFSFKTHAQIFWTEDFNNGCAAGCTATGYTGINGSWTVATTGIEGTENNEWYVSCAENGHTPAICATTCAAASATATLASLHVGGPPVITGPLSAIAGDNGALYLEGFCPLFNVCTQTNRRAESPVIDCTGKNNITVSFNYIEFGDLSNDNATVWYFDGTSWNIIADPAKTSCCGGLCDGTLQALWTAFSIGLPASANNNPAVRIGFRWVNNDDGTATDPSFAVDDVTLSTPSLINTVTTGVISAGPFCACGAVSVPFTSTGTFNPGNTYGAQLSDATGSFAIPIIIGVLLSTANSGTINAVIPCNTPAGTNYRIRVTSSNPSITANDNGIDFTVNPSTATAVTLNPSTTSICAGQVVTFTATPTGGGTTPTYQWQVNGVNAGTNSDTFSSATLANADSVTVSMTSNAVCPNPATTISNTVTITVNNPITPAVSINTPSTTICSGQAVTFTATPTNGGANPTYQWLVNGANAGTNSATFTSSTLTNGNTVSIVMTSDAPCATPLTANSNTLTITVSTSVTPSVTVVASATTICAGLTITFTATPTNGGTTPTYQWQVNGINAGTNSPNFSSSTFVNGDAVTVQMTSNSTCAVPATATSNTVTLSVSPNVVPDVTITSSTTTICAGQSITFTATPTNGGITPSYQWQLNSVNVGTNSTTFTSAALTNGNTVRVILTSNAVCTSPASDTSNAITITVNPAVTPAVTITASTLTVCAGDAVAFTANPINGGNSPTYQWQINGSNVGTNSSTFSSSTLVNGSVIVVIMTSSAACSNPLTANSNSIAMVVGNCPPTANFSGSPTSACDSVCATFTNLTTGGATSYSWLFPGGTPATSNAQTPPTICYTIPGTYSVVLVASNAFGSDTLIQSNYINVFAPIPLTITGNLSINACESTLLTALPSDGLSYLWGPSVNMQGSNTDSAVVVSPTETTQYYVHYADVNGCTDGDTATVVVTNLNNYFMPMALSPNGDGVNDEVHVHGRGIESVSLKIFDRIGEKVFETDDITVGWDGTYHGVQMNSNVFTYTLVVTFCNGEVKKENGNVTIVR